MKVLLALIIAPLVVFVNFLTLAGNLGAKGEDRKPLLSIKEEINKANGHYIKEEILRDLKDKGE